MKRLRIPRKPRVSRPIAATDRKGAIECEFDSDLADELQRRAEASGQSLDEFTSELVERLLQMAFTARKAVRK